MMRQFQDSHRNSLASHLHLEDMHCLFRASFENTLKIVNGGWFLHSNRFISR